MREPKRFQTTIPTCTVVFSVSRGIGLESGRFANSSLTATKAAAALKETGAADVKISARTSEAEPALAHS